ncbi:MAG: energy transducer TonB [Cyclobacteriaceae bacterium]
MKYPDEARRLDIEGKVYVQFIVNKDGNVDTTSVKAVKGVHSSIDREAIRVIKECPQFIPAREYENSVETVRQKMVVPIIFKLTNSKPEKKKGLFRK